MKNIKYYILLAMLILVACDENDPTNPTPEPELCPAPVEIPGIGYHRPPAHQLQTVSYDYMYLAFKNHNNNLKVLGLVGGGVNEFNLNEHLPDSVKLKSIEYLDFSPYSYEVMLLTHTLTDTLGTQTEYVEGTNLYVFDIMRKTLRNISPKDLGKAGSEYNIYSTHWMPQSNASKDYFLIEHKLYIPDEEHYVEIYEGAYYMLNDDIFLSNDGNYIIFYGQREYSGVYSYYYYIVKNTGNMFKSHERISFNYQILLEATKISWSPDNKYIAISARTQYLSGEPESSQMYFGISIVEFQDLLDPEISILGRLEHDNIIYPRKEFCMYMFGGEGYYGEMGTEFISDTTMAVSMHEDGAEYSYLYEISINGEMMRQLTFEP